jgi:hypothetical protein
MPAWAAALCVAAGVGIVAGVTIRAGLTRFKTIHAAKFLPSRGRAQNGRERTGECRMGETTDQMESHIENKREDLESNFRELQHKVKSATDWRQQFQNHTGTMVAAAFGGGMLVSTMVGRNRRTGSQPGAISAPASSNRRLRGAHISDRAAFNLSLFLLRIQHEHHQQYARPGNQ